MVNISVHDTGLETTATLEFQRRLENCAVSELFNRAWVGHNGNFYVGGGGMNTPAWAIKFPPDTPLDIILARIALEAP